MKKEMRPIFKQRIHETSDLEMEAMLMLLMKIGGKAEAVGFCSEDVKDRCYNYGMYDYKASAHRSGKNKKSNNN